MPKYQIPKATKRQNKKQLIGIVQDWGHDGISVNPIGQEYDELRSILSKFKNRLVKITIEDITPEVQEDKKNEY